MAMGFRPRGGAARRGRSGNRPVYEGFKPTYEWKHEEGASILIYHLPGFLKEKIRIIAESKGLLRIRGERLVTNNKWSRFEEQVMVPEDCNMSEIQAKFEGGILRINMPKKESTIGKTKLIEEQPKTRYEGAPSPSATRPNNVPPKSRHEMQEELPTKPTLPTIAQRPQFGTSISPPPPTPWIGNETQHETTPFPTNLPPINHLKQQENIYDDDTKSKSFVEDKKFQEDDELKGKYDEGIHHEKYDDDDALYQENKERSYDLSKMNRFDNYKQVMKSRLSKKSLDEDRQLLVNMGVALLLILALGASISYSFGSSG